MVATALSPFVADVRLVSFRELAEHGDVTDWLQTGRHTLADLLERAAKAPRFGEISAEPYVFPEEADIPAWDFLYSRHLLRGEVSGSAAMGGTGRARFRLSRPSPWPAARRCCGKPCPGRCGWSC